MFLDILTSFMAKCPALLEKKLYQNYFSPDIASYSIEPVAESPIYKSYTDGGAIYQTVFKVTLREPSATRKTSLICDFLSWVEEVNSPSSLPSLTGGFSPVALTVLKSGEVSSSPSYHKAEFLCRFLYTR